jgi:gas vesicle protein
MAEQSNFSFFLLGLGIGVGVGLLFAPQSGQETRGYLKNKADEGKDYVKRRSHDVRERAGELVEKGRGAVSRQRENIAEAVEAGKQAYRETVGEAQPQGSEPSPV